MTNQSALDLARNYLARGLSVLPVQYRGKRPFHNGRLLSGWQQLRLTADELPAYFNGQPQNIGVLLGEASGELVDVDLDCPIAVKLAPAFLPPTGAVFGRDSKRRSHWLYYAKLATKKFRDPLLERLTNEAEHNKAMLVELRSTGAQTVFPGSVHESGEAISWDSDGDFVRVEAKDLESAAARLAAATLLARHWPLVGSRQDAALALAGGLLRAEWSEDETAHFIEGVCDAAGDDETRSRIQAARYTLRKLTTGAHATGWPTLARLMGEGVVPRVREWLSIKTDAHYGESEKPEQWDLPAAFYEHDLPDFPVVELPDWLGAFVRGLARETQTPVDLAAMQSLCICAGSVAGKVRVQARLGWKEPLNLYTITAMNPANRKSAVFEATCEPLEEIERALVEERRDEIAQAASERRVLEERLNRVERDAAKTDDPAERNSKKEEAVRLAQELASMKVPTPPRLIAADATPEALASLLAEQGGRMCLFSPEGDLFDMLAGRYTGGAPNFDVILKGHSGDALRVDRRGRSEHVQHPALTIGLTVQPDVIRGLVDKQGFRGRGLIGRFLYSFPPSPVGRRQIAPEPLESDVRRIYKNNVKALAQLEPAQDYDGLPVARMLYLSSDANSLLKHFEAELEPQLAEDGELGTMSDWAGKLAGAVVRIASILHLAEHAQTLADWPERVAAETMSHAINIGRYLIPHARAAYAEMGADAQIENAKHLLRWIERTEQGSFTKREAHQAHKGRFKKVTDIESALELLEEHGYIRVQRDDKDRRPGRKPSQVFDVNPRLFTRSHNSQNPQNYHAEDNSEDSENCETESLENFSAFTSHEQSILGESATLSEEDAEEAIEVEAFPPGWMEDCSDEAREMAAILESYGVAREEAAQSARECFASTHFEAA